MPAKRKHDLPDGAAALIALARVAHRDGDRMLERAAVDKLSHDYGIEVRFSCVESVDRDLRRGKEAPR
jgi:hypothetical protein